MNDLGLTAASAVFFGRDEGARSVVDDAHAAVTMSAVGANALLRGCAMSGGFDGNAPEVQRAAAVAVTFEMTKALFAAMEELLGCPGCVATIMRRAVDQQTEGAEVPDHGDHIGPTEGSA